MPWRRAGVLASALIVLGGVLTASVGTPGQSLTTVRLASQGVSVTVPLVWAKDFHPTMAARPAATSAGAATGMLVATDADHWDDTEVPSYGVYTTVLPGTRPLDGVADTDPCEGTPQERGIALNDWEGSAWDWPDCNGSGAFTSVAVHTEGEPTTVYMEVRQPHHRPDLVDEIVKGLRFS